MASSEREREFTSAKNDSFFTFLFAFFLLNSVRPGGDTVDQILRWKKAKNVMVRPSSIAIVSMLVRTAQCAHRGAKKVQCFLSRF